MTPRDQVTHDWLLEHGYDAETVRRMMRAMEPGHEEAAEQAGRDAAGSWWTTALQQTIDPADRAKLTAGQLLWAARLSPRERHQRSVRAEYS